MASAFVILIFAGTYVLVAHYPTQKRYRWLKWILVGVGLILTVRFAIEAWFQ